jgi:hypothetical protein
VEKNRGQVKMKPRVDEGVVLVSHGRAGEANAKLLTHVQCRERIMGYSDMRSFQFCMKNV